MNFTQRAVDSLECSQSYSNIGPSSTNASTDINDSTSTSPVPTEASPIFQALKGYSLFKHNEKLEAIVNFLRLSSLDPVLTSGDMTNIVKLESICEAPKLLLKVISRSSSKYPSQWNSKFCAQFICDTVELIEYDMKMSNARSERKSPRKKLTSSLPSPAAALIDMYNKARLKVQNQSATTTRKRPSKVKTVQDLLLKSSVHNPECVEITSTQILGNLLCPICNHRSLVSLTTKEEAELANRLIRENYENKIRDWNTKGRPGQRPRMGKTESQVLGCVCYMQNCIGNSDGSGCFKCKDMNKEESTR